ncbi:hypothetical protein N7449_010973 [Penicillium cf. viridicatum]|uniref:Uncharacterized protein n=1 Tax=Penicillium cf. viridicatum TaxID=2972119 RepID=A0A9W9IW96_9EURO|nr:hypothetical protein N7449_010973 [Penicillium cf. viridicatum]
MKGHKHIVELLLRYGANPNARKTSGRTPIQEAAAASHNELVEFLVSKKVDINTQAYSDGWSSLHEVVHRQNIQVVKLLVDHGALLNVRLTSSKAPLHMAVVQQNIPIMEILLKAADPDVLMNEDITPLHLAGAAGWIPGIELLIQIGAEVNARDSLKLETPLHKAARNRELHAIKKLLELGANQLAINCDVQNHDDILNCAQLNPKNWAVDSFWGAYLMSLHSEYPSCLMSVALSLFGQSLSLPSPFNFHTSYHNLGYRPKMADTRPIPTFTDEQLDLLTQLRVRADDRAYAYQSIMGVTAGLINLHLGDIPHSSHLVPVMLQTLEDRMLGLLEELFELLAEAQMDEWTE